MEQNLGGGWQEIAWGWRKECGGDSRLKTRRGRGSRAGSASAFNTLPSALVKPTSLLSSLYPPFQASSPLAPPPLLQL